MDTKYHLDRRCCYQAGCFPVEPVTRLHWFRDMCSATLSPHPTQNSEYMSPSSPCPFQITNSHWVLEVSFALGIHPPCSVQVKLCLLVYFLGKMCTHTHTHTHPRTHARTHAHTHTHMQVAARCGSPCKSCFLSQILLAHRHKLSPCKVLAARTSQWHSKPKHILLLDYNISVYISLMK